MIEIGGKKYRILSNKVQVQENSISPLELTLTNQLQDARYNLNITKQDAQDTTKKLGGVEFKLEKLGTDGGPDATFPAVTRITSSGDADKGKCSFENLTPGSYRLTETKTAEGYTLLADAIEFTLTTGGQCVHNAAPFGDVQYDSTTGVYNIALTINNRKSFELPHTGADAPSLWLLIGLPALVAVLLVLVFHLDVAGVAIATICSQLLSAVLVVVALLRSEMTPYQLFPRQLHIHPEPMRGHPPHWRAHRPPVGDVQRLQHRHPGRHQLLRHRHRGRLDGLRQDGRDLLDDRHRHVPVHHHLRRAELRRRAVPAGEKGACGCRWGMLSVFTIGISAVFFFLARPILTIFTPDAAVLDIGVDMVRFLAPCYITYILIELIAGASGAGSRWGPCSSTCSACAACAWPGSSWWCPSTTP